MSQTQLLTVTFIATLITMIEVIKMMMIEVIKIMMTVIRDSSILGSHHLGEFITAWADFDPSGT